jgi:hypothetical protein
MAIGDCGDEKRMAYDASGHLVVVDKAGRRYVLKGGSWVCVGGTQQGVEAVVAEVGGGKVCARCGERLRLAWHRYCDVCYGVVKAEAAVRVSQFRLTIELVPSTSWFANLRNNAKAGVWDVIRRKAYADSHYRCSVCGASERLYCHEQWLYDDDKRVQKLGGFVALCRYCHMVKHIGFAGIFFEDYNGLIRHFCSVNGCCYEDFQLARAVAFDVWEVRSGFSWRQDLGEYADKMVDGRC